MIRGVKRVKVKFLGVFNKSVLNVQDTTSDARDCLKRREREGMREKKIREMKDEGKESLTGIALVGRTNYCKISFGVEGVKVE